MFESFREIISIGMGGLWLNFFTVQLY